jgi:hypothetical protein
MPNVYELNDGNPSETKEFTHNQSGNKISRNEVIAQLAQLAADFNNADCEEDQKNNDWMESKMSGTVCNAIDTVLALLTTPEERDCIYGSGEVHLYTDIKDAAGPHYLEMINNKDKDVRDLTQKGHTERNEQIKDALSFNNY